MCRSALDGKAILVTGAARGLGRAYAEAIAAAGGSVVIADIDRAPLDQTAAQIDGTGSRAIAVPGSVSDWSSAERLVSTCIEAHGRIDGFVNNAGISPEGPAWEDTESIARAAVDANVFGTLFPGLHALKAMRRQRFGVVINVSSGCHPGWRRHATYGATKGFVTSLTLGWALEGWDVGVRVNAVSPVARTRLNPETSAEPSEAAFLMAYLLSDDAARLTGQVVRLDDHGALSLMKGSTFRDGCLHSGTWSLDAIRAAFETRLTDTATPVGMLHPRLCSPLEVPVGLAD